MAPDIPSGSYAVFRPFRTIKPGDTVLVDHPKYGRIVKDVAAEFGEGFLLAGRNPESTTTEALGQIARPEIIGKLIWHLPPNLQD